MEDLRYLFMEIRRCLLMEKPLLQKQQISAVLLGMKFHSRSTEFCL